MEKLAVLANITNICEMLQGGEIDTVGCWEVIYNVSEVSFQDFFSWAVYNLPLE